ASVGRDEAGPERREVGQRARPRYTEARDTAPHPGYEGTPRAWRRARKRAHNAEHDAPPSGHKPLNGANSCAFPASMAISPLDVQERGRRQALLIGGSGESISAHGDSAVDDNQHLVRRLIAVNRPQHACTRPWS